MSDNYSYCGYNCDNCPVCKASKEGNIEELKRIYMVGPGIECSIESHGCLGCKSELRTHMCKTCFIRNCCEEKSIGSCAECIEFPCNYLKNYISSETMEYLKKQREGK